MQNKTIQNSKSLQKTIAVDFDGVIHGYSKGWQDGSIYDPPKEDAAAALNVLKNLGFKIVIYSTRNYDKIINGKEEKNQIVEIENYLNKYKIPYDEIWNQPGKPLCVCFIDDNAVQFTNWKQALGDTVKLVFKYL